MEFAITYRRRRWSWISFFWVAIMIEGIPDYATAEHYANQFLELGARDVKVLCTEPFADFEETNDKNF